MGQRRWYFCSENRTKVLEDHIDLKYNMIDGLYTYFADVPFSEHGTS
jgi:hypothetical protein